MKTKITLSALLCLSAMPSFAQKGSRLIAQSLYSHDATQFNLTDTTAYQFSTSNRGGDLNSRYISFDNATTYHYDKLRSTFVNYKKTAQKFDLANHREVSIDYYWNNTIGAWEEDQSAYYYITPDDSLTSKVNQTWDKIKGWNNTTRQSYKYDANKNRTSYIVDFWDNSTASWIGSENFHYEYDASNNLKKRTYQTWNTATSLWEDIYIDSFSYSSTNKVTDYTNILWDKITVSWKNYKKVSYAYGTADFLTEQTEQGWDIASAAWYNVLQTIITNDSKGYPLKRETDQWNSTTNIWNNFSNQFSDYDSKGNLINNYNQKWIDSLNRFVNIDQRSYTYDANNNLLSNSSAYWNSITGKWDNSIRLSYEYNSHNQKILQNHEVWDITGFWTHSGGDQLFNYYYEEFSTAIPEQVVAKGTLLLYPVPAAHTLNIKLKWSIAQSFTARITDIQGNVYRVWNVNPVNSYDEEISISDFSNGTYFIECTGSLEGSVTKAFTVIR